MIQRMFVTIDTKKTNYKNVGKINHGDDLILELTVLSDGDMISFNDPMVDLLVKKSDGKMIRQNSGIEHIQPNKFIIEVKKDCVTSPGLATNQLVINDNGRISTCMFYYTILNSLEEDVIQSISSVEVLEQLDEYVIEASERMELLNDNIKELEELFGATSDKLVEAEMTRNEAEQNRAQSEILRVNNENDRIEADNIRNQNEADRSSSELVREQRESERIFNEEERRQNESERMMDESTRQQNENTRQSNESIRMSNENDRKTQENRRATAETNRVNAETTRRNNESSRISNETERQKTIKEMKSLLEDARGFDDRVGVIEDEIEEINSSLDNIESDLDLNKVIFTPVDRNVENGKAGGECSCIISKSGKVILIDTGAKHSYQLIRQTLIKYNVNKVDYMIISHYHSDHVENLVDLQKDFDLSNTEYYLCKHAQNFRYADDYVLNAIGDNNKFYPNNGDVLNVDDLKITFVNCSQSDIDYYDSIYYKTPNYNNYSMCCYVENETFTIFFSGDISYTAQGRINELGYLKKVDVLKVEHHGCDITVNHDYLKMLNPKYSVISDCEKKYTKENIIGESLRIQNSMGVKTYLTGKETVIYKFNEFSDNINGKYPVSAVFKEMRTYNLIYLDKNYSGVSNGSYNHPYRTIREAMAHAYSLLPCNIHILTKDGNVFDTDEHLRIVNFYANLKIENLRIRRLHILNSNVDLGEVEVYGAENRAVYIDQSHVNIKTLTVNGDVLSATSETDGRGVAVYNSKVHANKIVISNKRIGLCCYNCGEVYTYYLEGENNEYGSVCLTGSTISTQWYSIGCTNKVFITDKSTNYTGGFTNDLTSYLQEGDDLNNYKSYYSRYVSKTGAITLTLLNTPVGIGYSFVMEVKKQTEDGSLMQVIKSRHLNGTKETGIWVRTYTPSDGWGLWYKLQMVSV